MSLWKVGDFFLLSDLCDLAMHELGTATRDTAKIMCFAARKIIHAIRSIYSANHEGLKAAFRPHLFGVAMSRIDVMAQEEGFKSLLKDIPDFAADWALELMAAFACRVPPQTGYGAAY